jgi:hypothetical protein
MFVVQFVSDAFVGQANELGEGRVRARSPIRRRAKKLDVASSEGGGVRYKLARRNQT